MEGGERTAPGFLDLVAGGTFKKRSPIRRDRRPGRLPRERRVVLRDRRRPLGLRRDAEVRIDGAAVHELLGSGGSTTTRDTSRSSPACSPTTRTSRAGPNGATDYEDFVRSDVRGQAEVMAWKTDHRINSPYPLRHNGTNVHVVEDHGDEATFASYIFVTQIIEGVAPALHRDRDRTVRSEPDGLRIAKSTSCSTPWPGSSSASADRGGLSDNQMSWMAAYESRSCAAEPRR